LFGHRRQVGGQTEEGIAQPPESAAELLEVVIAPFALPDFVRRFVARAAENGGAELPRRNGETVAAVGGLGRQLGGLGEMAQSEVKGQAVRRAQVPLRSRVFFLEMR